MDDFSFEETYAQMMDGELARALRSRRTLVPAARAALDKEIEKRQLDPEKLRKRRPHNIDGPKHQTEMERRLKGKRLPLPWIIVLIVFSFFSALALDHFGVLQLYWPIWITISIPVFTVLGFWDLKGRLWFWVTVVLIVAANVTLFGIVGWPWGTHWVPGRTIAGLCSIESIPIFAIIARIQKRLDRQRKDRLAPSVSAHRPSPAGKIDSNPS